MNFNFSNRNGSRHNSSASVRLTSVRGSLANSVSPRSSLNSCAYTTPPRLFSSPSSHPGAILPLRPREIDQLTCHRSSTPTRRPLFASPALRGRWLIQ